MGAPALEVNPGESTKLSAVRDPGRGLSGLARLRHEHARFRRVRARERAGFCGNCGTAEFWLAPGRKPGRMRDTRLGNRRDDICQHDDDHAAVGTSTWIWGQVP
jgi:hypothetical protein